MHEIYELLSSLLYTIFLLSIELPVLIKSSKVILLILCHTYALFICYSRSMTSDCTMKHFLFTGAKRHSITVVIDAGGKKCYDIVNSHHGVIKYSLAVGAEARSTGMLLTVFRTSCVSLFIGRSCSENCPNTINDFLCSRKFIFIASNSQRECKRDFANLYSHLSKLGKSTGEIAIQTSTSN